MGSTPLPCLSSGFHSSQEQDTPKLYPQQSEPGSVVQRSTAQSTVTIVGMHVWYRARAGLQDFPFKGMASCVATWQHAQEVSTRKGHCGENP